MVTDSPPTLLWAMAANPFLQGVVVPGTGHMTLRQCLDEALKLNIPPAESASPDERKRLISAYPLPQLDVNAYPGEGLRLFERWAHCAEEMMGIRWHELHQGELEELRRVHGELDDPFSLRLNENTVRRKSNRMDFAPMVEVEQDGAWRFLGHEDVRRHSKPFCVNCNRIHNNWNVAEEHAKGTHWLVPQFSPSWNNLRIGEILSKLAHPLPCRPHTAHSMGTVRETNRVWVDAWQCENCEREIAGGGPLIPLKLECPLLCSCASEETQKTLDGLPETWDALDVSELTTAQRSTLWETSRWAPRLAFTLVTPSFKLLLAWRALEVMMERRLQVEMPGTRWCANTEGKHPCSNPLPSNAPANQQYCSPLCRDRARKRNWARRRRAGKVQPPRK